MSESTIEMIIMCVFVVGIVWIILHYITKMTGDDVTEYTMKDDERHRDPYIWWREERQYGNKTKTDNDRDNKDTENIHQ